MACRLRCWRPRCAPTRNISPASTQMGRRRHALLFVANNLTPDGGKTIAAGNERVLRARLSSDARFFWDQDRKIRLEDRVDALKQRVYHEKLGSVYDKVERMEKLAELLVDYVPGADQRRARRAAHLAKADLSTGMVGEFPELQGMMGFYYSRLEGEDQRVAYAISDHYKPVGPTDVCPKEPDSVVIGLADKLDTLASFFMIGEKPTGSRDPFALRRAALGIIRTIIESNIRIPLSTAFDYAITSHAASPRPADKLAMIDAFGVQPTKVIFEVVTFLIDRLKVHMRERGIGHDLISAAFGKEGEREGIDDLVRLLGQIRALNTFLGTEDGKNLLIAYRRASNIVSNRGTQR